MKAVLFSLALFAACGADATACPKAEFDSAFGAAGRAVSHAVSGRHEWTRILKWAKSADVAKAVNAMFGEGVAHEASSTPEVVALSAANEQVTDIDLLIESLDVKLADLRFEVEVLRMPDVRSVREAASMLHDRTNALRIVRRFDVNGPSCHGRDLVAFERNGRGEALSIDLTAQWMDGCAMTSRYSVAWTANCSAGTLSGQVVADLCKPVVLGGFMASEKWGIWRSDAVDTAYLLRITVHDDIAEEMARDRRRRREMEQAEAERKGREESSQAELRRLAEFIRQKKMSEQSTSRRSQMESKTPAPKAKEPTAEVKAQVKMGTGIHVYWLRWTPAKECMNRVKRGKKDVVVYPFDGDDRNLLIVKCDEAERENVERIIVSLDRPPAFDIQSILQVVRVRDASGSLDEVFARVMAGDGGAEVVREQGVSFSEGREAFVEGDLQVDGRARHYSLSVSNRRSRARRGLLWAGKNSLDWRLACSNDPMLPDSWQGNVVPSRSEQSAALGGFMACDGVAYVFRLSHRERLANP